MQITTLKNYCDENGNYIKYDGTSEGGEGSHVI